MVDEWMAFARAGKDRFIQCDAVACCEDARNLHDLSGLRTQLRAVVIRTVSRSGT